MASLLLQLLIFFVITIIPTSAISAPRVLGDYEGAVYLKNYDGDTIDFRLPGPRPMVITIRINGIDTPEIMGKCGKEEYYAKKAQQMVENILKDAENISLKNIEQGKYSTIAAEVYADGKSLGDKLIQEGMAIRYEGEREAMNWCDE